MRKILVLASLAATEVALAHPGHGKPGIDHDHTLADLAVVLGIVLVVALAAWALVRVMRKKDW